MKILLDTSVLVAALVESHLDHVTAFPWLEKARSKSITGLVAAHSIAELYSILTKYPIRPRISPTATRRLIREDVLGSFQIVVLSEDDYTAVVDHLSESGIIGGTIYDALILRAALKAKADQVVTFNTKDFWRIYPELTDKIISP